MFSLVNTSNIAILLIGEVFRSPTVRLPCTPASIEVQKEATMSYVDNVFHPLKRLGHDVKMFYTMSKCANPSFNRLMRSWLPSGSVKTVISSTSMQHGWSTGYMMVYNYSVARKIEFDFIFQGRHDIMVPTPIDKWPGDFRKLLFDMEGRYCNWGCHVGSSTNNLEKYCGSHSRVCSADQFFWVPSGFFPIIYAVAKSKEGESGYEGWGHNFLHNFDDKRDYSFLFETCDTFKSDLICNRHKLYRPEDKDNLVIQGLGK